MHKKTNDKLVLGTAIFVSVLLDILVISLAMSVRMGGVFGAVVLLLVLIYYKYPTYQLAFDGLENSYHLDYIPYEDVIKCKEIRDEQINT